MKLISRICRALLGFALGVGFGVVGVVLALVMPLAMAGKAWREGGKE